jgi:hypothetical protein
LNNRYGRDLRLVLFAARTVFATQPFPLRY